MEIPLTLPLDDDGFLRRECSQCGRQFKLHPGPASAEAEGRSDPAELHCPICGQPGTSDSWFTQDQIDYVQAQAMAAATDRMNEATKDLFKSFSGNRSLIGVTHSGGFDGPDAPAPVVEPNDMVIVSSPCHGYEPIKVPESRPEQLHCVVCGQAFVL